MHVIFGLLKYLKKLKRFLSNGLQNQKIWKKGWLTEVSYLIVYHLLLTDLGRSRRALEQHEYDQALSYLDRSLIYAKKVAVKEKRATIHNYILAQYYDQMASRLPRGSAKRKEQLKLAEKHCKEAVRIRILVNDYLL